MCSLCKAWSSQISRAIALQGLASKRGEQMRTSKRQRERVEVRQQLANHEEPCCQLSCTQETLATRLASSVHDITTSGLLTNHRQESQSEVIQTHTFALYLKSLTAMIVPMYAAHTCSNINANTTLQLQGEFHLLIAHMGSCRVNTCTDSAAHPTASPDRASACPCGLCSQPLTLLLAGREAPQAWAYSRCKEWSTSTSSAMATRNPDRSDVTPFVQQ